MKTKLSPLQELRLERCRLKEECAEYEDKLKGNWYYAKGNFGKLTIGTIFSSAKNGIGDLFSLVSGKKHNSEKEEEEEDRPSSVITQMMLGAAPFIWEMVQPMIVGMIMKKVKSLFGGGEKKKKQVKKKKKASDLD